MRAVFLFIILALSSQLSYLGSVYGSAGCGDTDCMKCHTLSNEEVQNILSKSNLRDAKIVNVQMSPVRGLWEIALETKGQRGVFYTDFSKKYVINGPIIEVNAAINKTGERIAELNKDRKVDRTKIPLKDALVIGDKKAAHKVIVFTDPDCPFCGKFHSEIKEVVSQRKDIAFYIKLLPLVKLHPDALWKSKSILCNKSLKLLEENFEKKPVPKPDCETKEVESNIKLAEGLGISGTPTSIMPDGSVHTGFLEADRLIRIIDSAAKKGGS